MRWIRVWSDSGGYFIEFPLREGARLQMPPNRAAFIPEELVTSIMQEGFKTVNSKVSFIEEASDERD